MSLDRFVNKEEIIANNPASGFSVSPIKWTDELSAGGYLDISSVHIDTLSFTSVIGYAELHLYATDDGSYVSSTNLQLTPDPMMDSMNISTYDVAQNVNVTTGQYLGIVNILQNRVGSEEQPAFYIQEISTDRTEVYLRARTQHPQYSELLSNIFEDLFTQDEDIHDDIRAGNLVLNFGQNRMSIILSKAPWEDPDGVIVKLLKPLPEDIQEQSLCWMNKEMADPILKYFEFVFNEFDEKIYLRSPNFDANVEYNTITETDFQSFSQLLGSSTSTSEQIIQQMISGSFPSSPIGIDYSSFDNFVFYSSAAERLANFKYKLQQVEHYDAQLSLLETSASIIPSLSNDKSVLETRKSSIISSFDGFERWLYNEPTSSLFTHQAVYDREHQNGNPTSVNGGVLASDVYEIKPFPKFLIPATDSTQGEYKLHNSTSSIAEAWYNGTLASASLYDSFNDKSLLNTIPEHIRLDSNNDQYELFVNMIGHHFDILYAYADALAKTYHPIEHPKLGHTKDTLYNVAKSLGWKLFNGNQASALWQYKLGKTETGSYASTGSIFTKSDEDITTEVWRRIVNNLPHLLKTKGTARGIKALMNTYGIPQTLLSIREYGGPKVAEDVPLLIEDRFTYALQFNSGSSIRIRRDYLEEASGSWALPAIHNKSLSASPDAITSSYGSRPPDTIEFRIRPDLKTSMYVLSNRPVAAVNNLHWNLGIQYTGSYSGSDQYGRLFMQYRDLGGAPGGTRYQKLGQATTCFSDYVPLYDGDFWNIRLFTTFPFITASHNTPTVPEIRFQTQKASDYISDKIVHQTSGSLFPGSGSNSANANNLVKYWATQTETKQLVLGGETGSGLFGAAGIIAGQFSGSMQEYREWMEILDQETFNLHTTNPTSYVSSLSPTSSFNTLVRHYPLGTDLKAVDHTLPANIFITSSHPNQSRDDFSLPYNGLPADTHASASGFTTPLNPERGHYKPVEETYYIQGVSLGASLPKSQKIRFDNNNLLTNILSTTATDEVSRFDNASLDSNRLGLFYSMADQINKEIFNHVGNVELDDFVGDPDDQYELDYPDLTDFSNEYWKKYSDRNDINAFMRIFSQFDFSLFESIRQMLPDRADEVMGLLVEPHALERAKVVPFKKPESDPNHYETIVSGLTPETSGEYPFYEGEASGSPSMTGEVPYTPAAGDNGYVDKGNYFGKYERDTSKSTDYFTKQIFPIDERPSITSSILNRYIAVQDDGDVIRDEDFRFNTAHLGRTIFEDDSEMQSIGNINGFPFASDKIRVQIDTFLQTDTIQDIKLRVRHKDAATNGETILKARIIDTDNEAVTFLESPLSSSFEDRHLSATQEVAFQFSGTDFRHDEILFRDVHIPRETNVTVEFYYMGQLKNGETGHQIVPNVDSIFVIQTISKAGFSGLDRFIDKARPSTIFKKKKLHFHEFDSSLSKQRNDLLRFVSGAFHRSLFNNLDDSLSSPSKFTFSASMEESHYRDDESNAIDSKYAGSQVTAPGINVVSGYSELNFEPIVEIFITNPNQIVYNTTPQVTAQGQENPGNLAVGPGAATGVSQTIFTNRPPRPSRISYRR